MDISTGRNFGVALLPQSKAYVFNPHFPAYGDAKRLYQAQTVQVNGCKQPVVITPVNDLTYRFVRHHWAGAPAPARFLYRWRITPFQAQVETLALFTTHHRAFCLNDMGTGKTIAALASLEYLIRSGDAQRALVVAPLSTLREVWEMEALRYCPGLRPVVLHGDAARRRQLLDCDSKLYIINHDGIGIISSLLKYRDDIDVLIFDELAAFRNPTTNRWKIAREIARERRWVWGLTGTPCPNAPSDAWAQVKLIKEQQFPVSLSRFRDLTMMRVSTFTWIARNNAQSIVADVMQPSVRFTRDQCVDLPPITYSTRVAEMTSEQQVHYLDMLREAAVQLEDQVITAANAGVVLFKLVQIANGFIYDADGKAQTLPMASKLSIVKEIIEQAAGKILIFAPFRALVSTIHAHLTQELGPDQVASVTGQTGLSERTDIYRRFQHGVNPRIVVAHPACMAHGLNLTAASTIVWYAPIASLETYEQANSRVSRPGQKHNVHIIQLQSAPVEKKLYQVLARRSRMQDAVLEVLETKL
jgi:SNF2 family DNA or RNA helicase